MTGAAPRSAGSTSTELLAAMLVVFRLQDTGLVRMDPRDKSGRGWRRTRAPRRREYGVRGSTLNPHSTLEP